MKSFAITGVFALVNCLLPAQTPAKTAKPVTVAQTKAMSNEEMNLRAYIELLRTDVRKSKSQVMGDVMQLDAEESTKFWPVYKDFEEEYTQLGNKIVAVVKTYAERYEAMTDDVADQLANQVLAIEQERNALKKKYYDRMKAAMGAITATRFLQVENQLERLIDLQIAAELPVISQ
jgi:hypothetical protein